jgi:hypothetical protein
MADNYLQFSEQIDKLTDEEIEWLEDILRERDWEKACEALNSNEEEMEMWPDFAWALNRGSRTFWVFTETCGSLDQIIALTKTFLSKFRPTSYFYITYAETSSKMRIGEFGGGAIFVTANSIDYVNAAAWVGEKIEAFKKPKNSELDLTKLDLIKKWSEFFYQNAETFKGSLGTDLAYLWPAIIKGNKVEVSRRSRLISLLKEFEIPKDDVIWEYLDIV